MLIVPGGVFVLFVVAILGGPRAFANTVSYWMGDAVAWVSRWVTSF